MTYTLLAKVALAFLIVKGVFSAIGWYTKDDEDKTLRAHLVHLYVTLDDAPIIVAIAAFIERFLRRWEETFGVGRAATLRFLSVSFAINCIATAAFIFILSDPGSRGTQGLLQGMIVCLGAALFGLIPDFLASRLSIRILRWGLQTKRLVRFAVACVADMCLLFAAAAVNFAFGLVVTIPLTAPPLTLQDVVGCVVVAAILPFGLVHGLVFGENLTRLAVAIQVIGASLQTSLYLCIGSALLVARMTPRPIRALATRVTRRLEADSTPVFSQLGNAAGAVAGIVTAIAESFMR